MSTRNDKETVRQDFQAFLDSGASTDSREFRALRSKIYALNERCKSQAEKQFQEDMAATADQASAPSTNSTPKVSLGKASAVRRDGV